MRAALCSAGDTKTSQGVSSPWLRLNLWRLGSRSRSDAAYDTALAVVYFQVLPGDHDVSSAELAPQDEHVTASVRPPLAAQTSDLAEFGIILRCPRGCRGRVFGTYCRHLSIIPPGSSEVDCSTFTAQTHTSTRLLGIQPCEHGESRGRQGCALEAILNLRGGGARSAIADELGAASSSGCREMAPPSRNQEPAQGIFHENRSPGSLLVRTALAGGGNGVQDRVEAEPQPGGDECEVGERDERVARHVVGESSQQDEG